jgi:hypothetical protein
MGGHPNPVKGERRQNPVRVNRNHEKMSQFRATVDRKREVRKHRNFIEGPRGW